MADCVLKCYNLKQTIVDEAGSLIELNISYPQLSDMDDKYLEKRFNDYYSSIAEGLKLFSKRKLALLASRSRALNGTDFKKWAVVGKYIDVQTEQGIEIRQKIWVYKNGARKEKIFVKEWVLSVDTPFLYRLVNKAYANKRRN